MSLDAPSRDPSTASASPSNAPSSSTSRRPSWPAFTPRQYAGIALVALAYLGGLVGWAVAAMQVDAASPEGIHRPLDDDRRQPTDFATRPDAPMQVYVVQADVGDVPTTAVRV